MGTRRRSLGQGQTRILRKVLTAPLRQELQDAHARDSQRPRFPRAGRRGVAIVQYASTTGRAVEDDQLPRRRALGLEAEEQRILAQGSVRLAGKILPAGR